LDITLSPNTKYVLLGPNGCGKSTLIKEVISAYNSRNGIVVEEGDKGGGEEEGAGAGAGAIKAYVSGSINAPSSTKYKLGYLSQTSVSGSALTVIEECLNGVPGYASARDSKEHWENRLVGGDTSYETLDSFAAACDAYEAVGGDAVISRIQTVLAGLNFKQSDHCKLCSDFSGGWKMRISLSKLLLSEPDFLILDEPSNHLDSSSRAWLSNYITAYPKSVLLISHDVTLVNALLKNGKGCVLEINKYPKTGLSVYKNCNSYNTFLTVKQSRHDARVAEYTRNREEADRLEEWVRKFGASATKATMAQSKLKQIQRMKDNGLLDDPGQLILTGASALKSDADSGADYNAVPLKHHRSNTKIMFPQPPVGGGDVLISLTKSDIKYLTKDVNQLNDVSLDIVAGGRYVLRGPNGAGKSTLLKALIGDPSINVSPPNSLHKGNGVVVNVFTQDLAQELPTDSTPVEYVAEYVRTYDENISDMQIRAVLGQLGLSTFGQTQKIGVLSGGEKGRVALAAFILRPANLLVLDEPTNHLDVDTIAALAEGLGSFEAESSKKRAAIVVISHDREFVERLESTHVCSVSNGSVDVSSRALQESDWEFIAPDMQDNVVAVSPPEVVPALSDKERKRRHNAPRRMAKVENMVTELEAKISEIDSALIEAGRDARLGRELADKRDECSRKVEVLMSEWQELETLVAAAVAA
jgi:ATPase subunit of ABC transporter with duplicated ATPase domains